MQQQQQQHDIDDDRSTSAISTNEMHVDHAVTVSPRSTSDTIEREFTNDVDESIDETEARVDDDDDDDELILIQDETWSGVGLLDDSSRVRALFQPKDNESHIKRAGRYFRSLMGDEDDESDVDVEEYVRAHGGDRGLELFAAERHSMDVRNSPDDMREEYFQLRHSDQEVAESDADRGDVDRILDDDRTEQVHDADDEDHTSNMHLNTNGLRLRVFRSNSISFCSDVSVVETPSQFSVLESSTSPTVESSIASTTKQQSCDSESSNHCAKDESSSIDHTLTQITHATQDILNLSSLTPQQPYDEQRNAPIDPLLSLLLLHDDHQSTMMEVRPISLGYLDSLVHDDESRSNPISPSSDPAVTPTNEAELHLSPRLSHPLDEESTSEYHVIDEKLTIQPHRDDDLSSQIQSKIKCIDANGSVGTTRTNSQVSPVHMVTGYFQTRQVIPSAAHISQGMHRLMDPTLISSSMNHESRQIIYRPPSNQQSSSFFDRVLNKMKRPQGIRGMRSSS